VSQEWDEVLHEVKLMIERLNAFRDDLTAAAGSGKLTDRQREITRDCTVLASGCSVYLLELHVEATSDMEEKGDEVSRSE
jgi:hypothetical protein